MSERDSVHKEIEKLQEEIKEKNKKLAAQDGRHKHHEEEVRTCISRKPPNLSRHRALRFEKLVNIEPLKMLANYY